MPLAGTSAGLLKPMLNGKETLLKIRQMERFEKVPVVLFTTSCTDFDKNFARKYNAGFDNCIVFVWAYFKDVIQPARTIQYQSVTNRLPCQAGPGTTREDRNSVFRG